MLSRLNVIPRFALPYTAGDFAAALAAVVTKGPTPEHFEILGQRPKYWTRSGRQALRLILEGLDLRPGSGVAVPLFTDPSVVSAIAAAGHRPVFIDVDERTLTIDPASLHAAAAQFSATVVVHLFGHVAEMPELLQVVSGLPLIEDTAHSPLSYLAGRMTGDFGVASFYSFASTKYWPAGGGGLAVVNDATLAERLAPRIDILTNPSRLAEFRNVLLQAAKAAVFTRRMYGVFGKPMRRWAEQLVLLEPHLDSMAIQRAHAAVASRQALRLPQRVEHQRANSLRLLSLLADLEDVVLPWERPTARYNYHLFPVLLRDQPERSHVVQAMWSKFVDTSTIYYDVVKQCRQYGYKDGCPVAESVADRLLTLPNHAALSDSDIDWVAEAFRQSLKSARKGRPRHERRARAVA